MALSTDLISQFVKITNDSKKPPKETTVYGTVKNNNGSLFVQLDGSSMLTPVIATTSMKDGDRVTVMIKNHSAVVTGNLTSPSASSEALKELSDDLGIIGDDLGEINNDFDLLVELVSGINDNLEMTDADVEKLKTLTSRIEKTSSGDYTINGMHFGKTKTLWSGGMFMTEDHTITLSEPVSQQTNGIVLVFSGFDNGAVQNSEFSSHFVPKGLVSAHPGGGHSFVTTAGADFWLIGSKYLFIADKTITGYPENDSVKTSASGIKVTNSRFVLRYVLGV